MKFILKRVSQPLSVSDGCRKPPVKFPTVAKEEMTRWESWGKVDFEKLTPDAQLNWKKRGWDHSVNPKTGALRRKIGQDFVWVVTMSTLEELMILRERSEDDLIIEYCEEFQLPQITIYDDYLE